MSHLQCLPSEINPGGPFVIRVVDQVGKQIDHWLPHEVQRSQKKVRPFTSRAARSAAKWRRTLGNPKCPKGDWAQKGNPRHIWLCALCHIVRHTIHTGQSVKKRKNWNLWLKATVHHVHLIGLVPSPVVPSHCLMTGNIACRTLFGGSS